jgi:hypothetical protein
MIEPTITLRDIAGLTRIAAGILPADDRDAGAALVHAGPTIAERMRRSPFADVYVLGLQQARQISIDLFACELEKLPPEQMFQLLHRLRIESPAFFRQMRSDVCSLYLSDPGVWQRIGFPGPASDTGGYPDFDQPQSVEE